MNPQHLHGFKVCSHTLIGEALEVSQIRISHGQKHRHLHVRINDSLLRLQAAALRVHPVWPMRMLTLPLVDKESGT
jgi:hypothetical protein